VAELVDAPDSKSGSFTGVRVRFSPEAPFISPNETLSYLPANCFAKAAKDRTMGLRAMRLNLNQRTVFLFDGGGAAISVLSSALVLPLFSERLGLFPRTLYFLASFPFVFMIYSLHCYFFVKTIKHWMLGTLISANGIYVFISAGVIFSTETISAFGTLVLSVEILILLAVIAVEVNVYRNALQL
jgi:hypothetical protein